jgi:hypothetical protein
MWVVGSQSIKPEADAPCNAPCKMMPEFACIDCYVVIGLLTAL